MVSAYGAMKSQDCTGHFGNSRRHLSVADAPPARLLSAVRRALSIWINSLADLPALALWRSVDRRIASPRASAADP